MSLLGVELLEELGGEGSVFSDERGGFMVCGCWGVDGWIGVSGHGLSVIDAEGVSTECGMGLTVLEGLRPFLGLSTLWLLLRGQWFERVVVQVPGRRG